MKSSEKALSRNYNA